MFQVLSKIQYQEKVNVKQLVDDQKVDMDNLESKHLQVFIRSIMQGDLSQVGNTVCDMNWTQVDAVGCALEAMQVSASVWNVYDIASSVCGQMKNGVSHDIADTMKSKVLKLAVQKSVASLQADWATIMHKMRAQFGTINPNIMPDDNELAKIVEESFQVVISHRFIHLPPNKVLSLTKAISNVSGSGIRQVFSTVGKSIGDVAKELRKPKVGMAGHLMDVFMALLDEFGAPIAKMSNEDLSSSAKTSFVLVWVWMTVGRHHVVKTTKAIDALIGAKVLDWKQWEKVLTTMCHIAIERDCKEAVTRKCILKLAKIVSVQMNGKQHGVDSWNWVQVVFQWMYHIYGSNEVDQIVEQASGIKDGLAVFQNAWYIIQILKFYFHHRKDAVPQHFQVWFEEELGITEWDLS